MKFLTTEYIKMHARIDYDCEDEIIDLYGASAEDHVLNILNRSLDDLKEANGGSVPAPVIHAALLIAENNIRHRSPSESINLSLVPYGIDSMIKPYIVL